MELGERQESDSKAELPLFSPWIRTGEFLRRCFSCRSSLLRQIQFMTLVALYLPDHVPKILEYPAKESPSPSPGPKNPTLWPGVHLCEADIPQMRQEEGIKLFWMELRDFFFVYKNTSYRDGAATLSHFFLLCHFWMGFVAKPLGIPWYLLVQLPRELNLFFSPPCLSPLQSSKINIFSQMLLN